MAKRRTKGDGGLSQRHDHATCPPADADGERPDHACKGRWVGTFAVTLPGGRKQRKTVYGKTQGEARSKLNKAQRQAENGTLVLHAMTVETWVTEWLAEKKKTLKPQSYYMYETAFRRYIVRNIGHVKLADLTPDHIKNIYKWMETEQGLSSGTIYTTHAVLKVCLKDAVFEGKLPTSPMEKVRTPTKTVEERQALSLPQAHAVLKAAGDNPRWWLAVFYGMRQGEVLGLTWGDINWTNKVIHVRQTLQRDRELNVMFLGTPKTKSSVRDIPMFPMIEARLKVKYLTDGMPADNMLVFGSDATPRSAARKAIALQATEFKPTPPQTDHRQWKELLVRATVPPLAPIPDVPLHAARNTAASLMDEAGLSPRVIADILGHTNVQMTFKYQRTNIDRMRDELAKLNDILPSAPLALPAPNDDEDAA